MSRTFKPGDRISFIDEVGGGVVLEVLGVAHVRVKTDEGFILDRRNREMVLVADQAYYGVTDHQAGMVKANDVRDEKLKKHKGGKPLRIGKTPKRPEDKSIAQVDLHLHELVEDETRLQQGERLKYQLAYFERALEGAIRDGKRKLIVIHGVGEGVLREEVRRMLQFYEGVRFHDADMRQYGSGATEVEILRHR